MASNIRFNRTMRKPADFHRPHYPTSQQSVLPHLSEASWRPLATAARVAPAEYAFESQQLAELQSVLRDRLTQSQTYKACIIGQKIDSVKNLIRQSLLPDPSILTSELGKFKFQHEQLQFMIEFCTLGKPQSIAVQEYLESLSAADQYAFSQVLKPHLLSLITDKYASYTLQRLALTNEDFQRHLEASCRANFEWLVVDEYASRVMQVLVQRSNAFRHFCLDYFKAHPDMIQFAISAVFLAATTIRFAKSQKEITFFGEMIQSLSSLSSRRYLKRIIVSYIERCGQSELCKTFHRLGMSGSMRHLMNDKYSSYIILMFLQRGCPLMLEKLNKAFRSDPFGIMNTRYFGFIIIKLIERDEDSINRLVNNLLLELPMGSVNTLVESGSSELATFLVYITIYSVNRQRCLLQHPKIKRMTQDMRDFFANERKRK